MNTDPAPDDDVELDFELRRRVREALRDVPVQPSDMAQRAVETAMTHWAPPARRRQPLWLVIGAAAIVGVVGVVVVGRSDTAPPDDLVAEPVATGMSLSSDTRMAGAPETDGALEAARMLVRADAVVKATCPLEAAEQSFGTITWNGAPAEVLADIEANTLRLVDDTSCELLVQVPLEP